MKRPAPIAALIQALDGRFTLPPPRSKSLSGTAILEQVRVYRHPLGHWYYVTVGLSSLDENTWQGDTPFEMTVRVVDDAEKPPRWPVDLLCSLAEDVAEGGDIRSGSVSYRVSDAGLKWMAFIDDPEPAPVDGLRLLQVVGLTHHEYGACHDWSGAALLSIFSRRNPLHLTTLTRPSWLDDREVEAAVEEGRRNAPSSIERFYFRHCKNFGYEDAEGALIEIDRTDVETLRTVLHRRLMHGRSAHLVSRVGRALLRPAERNSYHRPWGRCFELDLTPATVAALAKAVGKEPGQYTVEEFSLLCFEVIED